MIPMKIYIAGSSKDIERCEAWRDRCVGAGIEITEDWMSEMRSTPNDALLDHDRLVACALADIRGVETADVLWLLAPPVSKPSGGCWNELDRAQVRGKPIVYSPPPVERPQFNIFTTLIDTSSARPILQQSRICKTDDEAFAFLLERLAAARCDHPAVYDSSPSVCTNCGTEVA